MKRTNVIMVSFCLLAELHKALKVLRVGAPIPWEATPELSEGGNPRSSHRSLKHFSASLRVLRLLNIFNSFREWMVRVMSWTSLSSHSRFRLKNDHVKGNEVIITMTSQEVKLYCLLEFVELGFGWKKEVKAAYFQRVEAAEAMVVGVNLKQGARLTK